MTEDLQPEYGSRVHELKTTPTHFENVWMGRKKFEARKNDRGFQEGDKLCLLEFDPEPESYTGRKVYADVTHVLRGPGYGIAEGYAVLSIDRTCLLNRDGSEA